MLGVTVHSSDAVLVIAVFLACAVEMVEALTIVIAVGTTASWRAALEGSAAALAGLGLLVLLFGPALARVPLDVLRLVVGSVLLVFGLQWLRKAVLRAAGIKVKRDEDAEFAEAVVEIAEAQAAGQGRRVAFIMAFKGVFLEGLEVVITVLALGASAHRLGLAAATAGVAILLVGLAGVVVARQLTEVPENAMKLGVGLMLTSFGTFWVGEGLHLRWPGSDGAVVGLVALYGVGSWLLVRSVGTTPASSTQVGR